MEDGPDFGLHLPQGDCGPHRDIAVPGANDRRDLFASILADQRGEIPLQGTRAAVLEIDPDDAGLRHE